MKLEDYRSHFLRVEKSDFKVKQHSSMVNLSCSFYDLSKLSRFLQNMVLNGTTSSTFEPLNISFNIKDDPSTDDTLNTYAELSILEQLD